MLRAAQSDRGNDPATRFLPWLLRGLFLSRGEPAPAFTRIDIVPAKAEGLRVTLPHAQRECARVASSMARRIPTQLGDVLILRTDRSFTIHAVGPVSRDGQQDLHHQTNVKHVRDRAAAEAEAKALVASGGQIFFLNIDSGDWAEILTLAGAIRT